MAKGSGPGYLSSPFPTDLERRALMSELDDWNPGGSAAAAPDSEARNFSIVAHLGGFAGYIIPFGNILAPLVVWILKRDEQPFVDHHGREALNFQISITIYAIVSGLLILLVIGVLLLPLVLLFNIVMMIVAAVKASNGEHFRYPLTLRLVS